MARAVDLRPTTAVTSTMDVGVAAARWPSRLAGMSAAEACGAVALFLGVTLNACAALVWRRQRAFLARAEQMTGRIVGYEERTGTDSDMKAVLYFHPIVEFEFFGRTRRFTNHAGSAPARGRVGDRVKVVYDVADPASAQLRDFLSLWMGVLVLAFIGLCFIATGACIEMLSRP